MSVTTGTFPGVRIVDMPDLGAATDTSSVVGEHAGSGRFSAPALRSYVLNDFASVKQFGAIGDGVTNDTVAVQAAINATLTSNKGVWFPAGTYLVDNLYLPHNTEYDTAPPPLWQRTPRLVGSPGATIKKRSSSDNTYLLAAQRWVTNVQYPMGPVWIENLVLDGAGIAGSCYVGLSYSAVCLGNVFRNATQYGVLEPDTTRSGLPLLGSRSVCRYERNQFSGNGIKGFSVAPDVPPNNVVISDFWFQNNTAYDNGTNNLDFGQTSGFIIQGNHCWWTAAPTTPTGYSVYLGDGVGPVISGNIWEGYGTTHFGAAVQGGASGPITLCNDVFVLGLGCTATFNGGTARSIRIKDCKFADSTFLQHSYSSALCELVSEGNTFATAGAYQFSAGDAHAGILVSRNDRVGAGSQLSFGGRQLNNSYAAQTADGVVHPLVFPYTIAPSDPNVIRVTLPLTADSVIVLPDPAARGMRYRVIRVSTSTGAFTLHVRTSAAAEIATFSVAGAYTDIMNSGPSWVMIGGGVTNVL